MAYTNKEKKRIVEWEKMIKNQPTTEEIQKQKMFFKENNARLTKLLQKERKLEEVLLRTKTKLEKTGKQIAKTRKEDAIKRNKCSHPISERKHNSMLSVIERDTCGICGQPFGDAVIINKKAA